MREWEIHLKSLVDSFPSCRFVGTGSAALALRLKSTESGAGRFSNYILPPLSFAEYLMFIEKEDELIETNNHDSGDSGYPSKKHEFVSKDIDQLNEIFIN